MHHRCALCSCFETRFVSAYEGTVGSAPCETDPRLALAPLDIRNQYFRQPPHLVLWNSTIGCSCREHGSGRRSQGQYEPNGFLIGGGERL